MGMHLALVCRSIVEAKDYVALLPVLALDKQVGNSGIQSVCMIGDQQDEHSRCAIRNEESAYAIRRDFIFAVLVRSRWARVVAVLRKGGRRQEEEERLNPHDAPFQSLLGERWNEVEVVWSTVMVGAAQAINSRFS